jgi:hypothetical protein
VQHFPSIASFLLALGFQVSGFQNFYVAIVLWGLAGVLFAIFSARPCWRWLIGTRRTDRVIFRDPNGRKWLYREIAELSEAERHLLMEQRPDVWRAFKYDVFTQGGPGPYAKRDDETEWKFARRVGIWSYLRSRLSRIVVS